jgi:hypothetical protein
MSETLIVSGSKKKTVIVSGSKKKTTVKVADVGNAGPAGAAGVSGGNYTHVQSSPSTTWTVVHNLGYFPGGVSVIDSGGTKVYGDITHSTINQLVINFSAGFGGKVYLS